jgi:hypothetical protein
MTKQPVFAFFLGPPAIPIHDNGDMPGQSFLFNLIEQGLHKGGRFNEGAKLPRIFGFTFQQPLISVSRLIGQRARLWH